MGRVPYGRTGSFLISLIMATSKVDFFYIKRVGFFVPIYLVLFSRNLTWKESKESPKLQSLVPLHMPLESKLGEVLTATFEFFIVLGATTNPLEYLLQGTCTPANMAAFSCTCQSSRSKSPRVLVSRLTAH